MVSKICFSLRSSQIHPVGPVVVVCVPPFAEGQIGEQSIISGMVMSTTCRSHPVGK